MQRCHAIACPVEIPSRLFMCARHWGWVPEDIRYLVMAAMERGRSRTRRPGTTWLFGAAAAVVHVARLEGHDPRDSSLVRFAHRLRASEQENATNAHP